MAINDWTKSGERNRWKNVHGGLDIKIVKKPRSKVFAVFKVLGDENFGYLHWEKLSKDFSSESDALAFVKNYMGLHNE